MVQIIKVEKETFPALRFIGKRCLCNPADFAAKWSEWFECGWFEQLEKLTVAPENGNFYLGMTSDSGSCYWIGLLFPPDTPAPDGFEYADVQASNYVVFEIAGKRDGELLSEDGAVLCFGEMEKRNLTHKSDGQDFERYSRPATEGEGKILIDCLFAIE